MMDAHDTNQPLNQGELEEEKKTVEVSEAITETPLKMLLPKFNLKQLLNLPLRKMY